VPFQEDNKNNPNEEETDIGHKLRKSWLARHGGGGLTALSADEHHC